MSRRWLRALPLLLCAIAGAVPATAAQRLVTVGGAVTEIVFALGAGERIVATDSTSSWPAATRQLSKIGYLRALAAEGVLSTRPTHIVAAAEAGPPAVLTQLRGAGVRVTQLATAHSAASVADNIRRLSSALELGEAGTELAARFERDWNAAEREVAALPGKPRILFVLDHGGGSPMVAGRDTAADAMLRYAGAINTMHERFAGYRPLTPESALAAAPDVIVTTDEAIAAAGGREAFLARPGLAALPAAKAGRLLGMDALRLLGFGPRLPDTVRDLARLLRAL